MAHNQFNHIKKSQSETHNSNDMKSMKIRCETIIHKY